MYSFDVTCDVRKMVTPEFLFGVGVLDYVVHYVRNLGGQKVLLVTDPGIEVAGWVGRMEDLFRSHYIDYAIFNDVSPNPRDHEVMAGAEFYREHDCDMIVVLGGGSPIDCAKSIGVVVTNRRNVLEFEGVDEVEVPGPPLICIPTTAGTSADVSQFAVIKNTQKLTKIAIVSKMMVPDVSLIDPFTTTTMDAELTATTGMDALTHAFEAFVSNASSPITDMNAVQAAGYLIHYLKQAVDEPENLEARGWVMMGSLLAGIAFSNASLGLVHGMAHSLGGLKDIPHGICNALLLDRIVDFNFEESPDKYTRLAQVLYEGVERPASKDIGSPDEVKAYLVSRIRNLRKDLGITSALSDYGVTKRDLPALVENAFNDACLATNPRTVTEQEIKELYERIIF